jgi:hypothetical protein
MATITISLAGSGIINGSKAFTVSDSDVQRIITATAKTLNLTGQTNAQLLLAYAGWIANNTKEMVKVTERNAAVLAAANAVPSVTMT